MLNAAVGEIEPIIAVGPVDCEGRYESSVCNTDSVLISFLAVDFSDMVVAAAAVITSKLSNMFIVIPWDIVRKSSSSSTDEIYTTKM